ncbi:hypothetical protein ACOME3_007936 [Neoechinorhynchus agilis]
MMNPMRFETSLINNHLQGIDLSNNPNHIPRYLTYRHFHNTFCLIGTLKKSKYGYLDWKKSRRDTFGEKDLRKLLLRASHDLNEIDRRRRAAFEVYEHHKHEKFLKSIRHLKPDKQKELIEQRRSLMKQVAESTKFDPPGSKKQLNKVWQEMDNLEPEHFDPLTFFKLHDIDGNGYLDANEVTALFEKEIDNTFNSTSGIDHVERNEEANRMREEFMRFYDEDKDNLVSMDEFLRLYKRSGSLDSHTYEGTVSHHAKDYANENYYNHIYLHGDPQYELGGHLQHPQQYPAHYSNHHYPQDSSHPNPHKPALYPQNFQYMYQQPMPHPPMQPSLPIYESTGAPINSHPDPAYQYMTPQSIKGQYPSTVPAAFSSQSDLRASQPQPMPYQHQQRSEERNSSSTFSVK